MIRNLFFIFSILIFCSCSKDKFVNDEYTINSINFLDSISNSGNYGCFDIVYPIKLIHRDIDSIEILSRVDLYNKIEKWDINKEGSFPTFVYPIIIISDIGEIFLINDSWELNRIVKEYASSEYKSLNQIEKKINLNPCYEILFPISCQISNQSSKFYNTKKELIDELIQNYNLYEYSRLGKLKFPVKVFTNDKIIFIQKIPDYQILKKNCR